jgi:hypothetical protein
VATTTLVRLWVLAFGFMVKREGDDTLVGNDEQTNMAGGRRGADTFVCNQEGEDIIVDYRPEQDSNVIENQVLR